MDYMSLFSECGSTGSSVKEGILFGARFRLKEKLGAGGFGQVWLANDTWLEQDIALKIGADDLKNETRTLRLLPKDRYVSIFDFIQDSTHEASAYSMEILSHPWQTLEKYSKLVLRPCFSDGDVLWGLRATMGIASDVLESLEVLHGQVYSRSRWCHGDIKPANIYVNKNRIKAAMNQEKTGFARVSKIGDLGLVRQKGDEFPGGTAGFVCWGQPPSPKTDVFSVGQTIAYIVCGSEFSEDQLIHKNRIFEHLRKSVGSDYLAERLTECLRKMTLRHPAQRPSASDAAKSLMHVVDGHHDWDILRIFYACGEAGQTLVNASEALFHSVAQQRGWKNRTQERVDEMKVLIRSAYRRGILHRTGHRYYLK